MSTPLQATCSLPYVACTSPRAKPQKHALRTRLAKLAIVVALLVVMFSGERWVLEHSSAGVNELIVATCAADAVFGNTGPAKGCPSDATRSDGELSSE